MDLPQTCVICDGELENIWHVLINCHFAQQCWREVGILNMFNHFADECDSISDWLSLILDKLSGLELSKVCMVAWSIWKQRNSQLWSSSLKSATDTVYSAMQNLFDWIAAKQIDQPLQERTCEISPCYNWHVPPSTYIKCNIDAAFFEQEKKTGIGMVLRNDAGEFMVCRTIVIHGLLRVEEGEAMGLHEALSWIRQLSLEKVIFELDSKVVVDEMHKSNSNLTELGMIIGSCCHLLNSASGFSVCFVRRQANEVAHALARASRFYASPTTWVEPPSHISGLLVRMCTDLNH